MDGFNVQVIPKDRIFYDLTQDLLTVIVKDQGLSSKVFHKYIPYN